jgi:hypothetical protein
MSGRRQSLGGSSSSGAGDSVMDAVKLGQKTLEALAKKVQRNDENMPDNVIRAWKDELAELSQQLAELKNQATITKQVVTAELGNRTASASSSSAASSSSTSQDKELEARIKASISNRCTNFDAKDDAAHMNVLTKMKMNRKMVEDDDLEMVEKELTEQDFKCPVTGMHIVRCKKG